MRQAFVQVKSKQQAERECPWASKVTKVCGGYICFESITDYQIWNNQK